MSGRDDERGPAFWFGLAVGAPLIAWGIRGVFVDAARVDPGEWALWIGGSAVVHDLIVLPFVLISGLAARRIAPSVMWRTARWALATTGVLLLVSWPFVRGYGRSSGNPSLLPRDYGGGLLVAIALVWATALVAAVAVRGRRNRGAVAPGQHDG